MVLMYCDNQAAVISLNTGRCRETWTMLLIRCLFFIKAFYRLELRFVHLPGKDNVLANALSRNDIGYFYSQVPAAHRYRIPPRVFNVLATQQPDWTSVTWTQLFSSCFLLD